MKFSCGILALCFLNTSNAFISNHHVRQYQRTSAVQRMVPSVEDSAKQLTEYMSKSHEEKLKAIKKLEDEKNSEIKALKDELAAAKSEGSIVVSTPEPMTGSIEDLSKKLLAYQSFMAEYIVKAQEEKYKAVKAAEAAASKKYEDKMSAFLLTGSSAPALTTAESKSYVERNANLAAATKAGKSPRWGDKEVQRVTGIDAPKASVIKPAEPSTDPVSLETIAAADHGLRADGGVGGLTLAERLTSSAAEPSNVVAIPVTSTNLSYFDQRSAYIANAAKSGKQTRWGSMEENKCVEFASNALPAANGQVVEVTPEIAAADHGLRSDGGVGGPSLAERVNLGARLL
mmetsp:Transcript_20802/g.23586  ORF Transcript_20802/g.23586 Transcript_20802/m.23586 type:complete len:344 (-) Transcript_20802:269-1300(-)